MEGDRPPRWPPRQTWRRRATALNDATKDVNLARLPFLAVLGGFILVVSINDLRRQEDWWGVGGLLLVTAAVVVVCVKALDWRILRDARWLDGFDRTLQTPVAAATGLTLLDGPPWPEWLTERDGVSVVHTARDRIDLLRVATHDDEVIVALARARHLGRVPHVVVARRLRTKRGRLSLWPRSYPGRKAFDEWYVVKPDARPVPAALRSWLMGERRRIEVVLDGEWLSIRPSYTERRKATRSIRRAPAVEDVVAELLRWTAEVASALDHEPPQPRPT